MMIFLSKDLTQCPPDRGGRQDLPCAFLQPSVRLEGLPRSSSVNIYNSQHLYTVTSSIMRTQLCWSGLVPLVPLLGKVQLVLIVHGCVQSLFFVLTLQPSQVANTPRNGN